MTRQCCTRCWRGSPGAGAADVDCAWGWWPVIANLDHQIAAIAPDYKLHQIKQKFGGLRFYYGLDEVGFDPRIDDLIEHAEQIAARTCEPCRAPGRSRGGGWIKTLCDAHASGR